MTETPPKSAARLLVRASTIAKFKGDWPDEFLPGQLAGLMAGSTRKENRAAYDENYRLVLDGIESGSLKVIVKTVVVQPQKRRRVISAVPVDSGLYRDFGGLQVTVATPQEKSRQTTQSLIDRLACKAWLDSIREQPGELLLAWLGLGMNGGNHCSAIALSPTKDKETKTAPRIKAIVATAKNLGYEPLNITYGGKAAIKAECMKDAKLFTDATFDKAWKAAKKANLVEVENVETYRGQ